MIEGCATLTELETAWSMDDVADCNDFLDMRRDVNAGDGKC